MLYELDVPNTNNGVSAAGLSKRFGDFWALRDLDLSVQAGTVLGLLGHNGAGKTTTIRILTTLSRPTSGTAQVAGHDVVLAGDEVRKSIGVAGQAATVDGLLSGRANLEMVGRLYGLSAGDARRKSDELLERLGLADSATKLVKTFSGGMRRRVDLAASLIGSPAVLFLDEPTTGLDPQSRNDLWAMLREYVNEGGTLLLTTQYLEEADRLADEIVVLDHGRVAASGKPAELKSRIGGDRIEILVADAGQLEAAADSLAFFTDVRPVSDREERLVSAPVSADTRLIEVVRALDAAGIEARDIHRREATLDDAFLALTSPEPVLAS